ncbi:MAG: HAD hydrolase-like protein [Treponema sp.]|nr:HAD hydrolase-like protein [Treponema sp.]
MRTYTTLFFDFDGTLFDTSEGVFHSFDYVVDFYRLNVPDKSVYNTMIGPPLLESFSRVFHFEGQQLQDAIAKYREYYTDKGMFECCVYDGVVPLIEQLRAAGKHIVVATSKPEVYAKQILQRKNMLHLFDFVGGSDLEEQVRVHKVDIINYVLQSQGIAEKTSCLMIGDTRFDIEGAQKAGLDSLGILWGFGTKESLEHAGATYIAASPPEAGRLLLGR